MAKFPPPTAFDFTKPEGWPTWKDRFARFHTATKLIDQSEDVQIASLIYAMGSEAENVFKSFTFAVPQHDRVYRYVLKKFDDYFVPKVNVVHERSKFNSRVQQPGETAEAYIRAVFQLVETCKYHNKDEMVRDRLLVGILDKELAQTLQTTPDLSLQDAVNKIRSAEMVRNQVQQQQGATAALEEAKRGYKPQNRNRNSQQSRQHQRPQQQKPQQQQPANGKCGKCGLKHKFPNYCPAVGKTCNFCKGLNHFSSVCRARLAQGEVSADTTASEFLGAIETVECARTGKPWYQMLTVNTVNINFKIDTGADVSCIPVALYNKMQPKPKLSPTVSSLHGPCGHIETLGQFNAETVHKGETYNFRLCVIKTQFGSCLLQREVACALGLVKRLEAISDVFGDFGLLKNCEPIKIKLKADAVPYSLAAPRRIAEPLLKPVQEELERMQANDIIAPITEPTDWCSPMVPVPKKSGQVRICVDLTRLNRSVQRELFFLPTIEEIASKLAGSKIFTTLDFSQSFWQLPLDPEDAKKTTFITPIGRFFFKRLPYGLNSSTEIFQRKMREILSGIDGVCITVDDVLIHHADAATHDVVLQEILKRIEKLGLRLNKAKCKFKQTEVKYCGQIFSAAGMKADPDKVAAILQLDAPDNITQLRQVLGMANYLAKYVSGLSTVMQPMADLLRKDNSYVWGPTQEKSFQDMKRLLSSAEVLAYYDMTKPTIVSADASSYGIGACLMQNFDGDIKPIAFASRLLTDTEKRWAQIEKECLASVWACEKFSHFLLGLPSFRLLTDHKPLVPLMNDKDLDRTPLRCQRLLMRLMRFNATAEYVPGKTLVVADTLSRQPQRDAAADELLAEDTVLYVDMVRQCWPASDEKLQEIAAETSKDPALSVVLRYLHTDWPQQLRDVPDVVQPYYSVKATLSENNGIVTFGDRIVVPAALRKDMLNRVHDASHQGKTKCKQLAETCIWWPGMAKAIDEKCQFCAFCEEHKPMQRHEPLITTPLPDGPWKVLATDLCEFKKRSYLIVVDYYSRYIEICDLSKSSTSAVVIGKLKNMFAKYGCPEEVRSDGGPQYTSQEFKHFAKEYCFRHVTSSPHFPQSNGAAERAVQVAKGILKQQDPYLALMMYRSTPHSATGVSPAQLLFGRRIRTPLPALPQQLCPSWPDDNLVRSKDAVAKEKSAFFFNRRHGVRPLTPLTPGQDVQFRHDKSLVWTPGVVKEIQPEPRSYLVDTGNGVYRRNRQHIRLSVTGQGGHQNNNTSSVQQPSSVVQEPTISVVPDSATTTRSGRVVKPVQKLDL